MAAEISLPKALSEIYLGFLEDVEPPSGTIVDLDDADEADEPFRSKVGGYVDWLSKLDAPPLCTGSCQAPMPLLMQIYAPLDEVCDDAYHRFLYVFACPNVSCHDRASPYSVLRYQQPQKCPLTPLLLSEGNAVSASQHAHALSIGPLCPVCGHAASMRCARCKAVQYCSKAHQVAHWKNGHSASCESAPDGARTPSEIQQEFCGKVPPLAQGWPPFAMSTAREKELEEAADGLEDQRLALKGAAEALKNHQKGVEINEEDFTQGKEHIDKQTIKFQAKVAVAPDQILRYGHPVVWVHGQNQPLVSMIPDCSNCGSPRRYECQILPQILYFLHVDTKAPKGSPVSINFSTIAIYTCSASCTPRDGSHYSPEYLFIQHE